MLHFQNTKQVEVLPGQKNTKKTNGKKLNFKKQQQWWTHRQVFIRWLLIANYGSNLCLRIGGALFPFFWQFSQLQIAVFLLVKELKGLAPSAILQFLKEKQTTSDSDALIWYPDAATRTFSPTQTQRAPAKWVLLSLDSIRLAVSSLHTLLS